MVEEEARASTPVLAVKSGAAHGKPRHREFARKKRMAGMPGADVGSRTGEVCHVTASLFALFGAPVGHVGRPLRRLTALAALTAGVLLSVPAATQEPLVLTGAWVGTWWIGKYEEPIELALTQTRGDLVGHVVIWGYPGAGSSPAAAAVRAPVTGSVEGPRVQLKWTMPPQGQFSAELVILSPDRLFGIGGVGSTTTGFGLHRAR
jgi:hypothetical protein